VSAPETPSVYADCVAAGLEIDSHESDLYVRDTPEAREILARHRAHFVPFVGTDAAAWLDAPFLYLPFWADKGRVGK
jgi:hypothetical protein